ncbi:DUF4321 domain-containing protein [Clostridium swellfunianum]|uniref:DUF4321 domain-containing protein n=1 Tax=Clostridium swellfunianum TaxID=1367462 RepID=UPI00202E72EF|nr:DUF4321 domain-containing protein [Clostridium swellfunianum]MCM0648966.1 DUF4321 domain-containing protein [Clostridium swellfunianum]
MRGSEKSNGFLIFVVLLGAIGGTLLGDVLGANVKALNFLRNAYSVGTAKPLTLDLKVLSLSFGINFSISLMSIIGIIVAIILYRKL